TPASLATGSTAATYCAAKESPISWTPTCSLTAPNAHFDCELRLQGQNPNRCRSATSRASGDRRHGQPSCRLAMNDTDAIATMAAPAKPATETSDELRARNGVSTVRYISSANAMARTKTHSLTPAACAASPRI